MIVNNKSPVFICGFPSGGTDLLKTILNAHPEVCITGEIPLLTKLLDLGYNNKTIFQNVKQLRKFQIDLKKNDLYNNISNIDIDINSIVKNNMSLNHAFKLFMVKDSQKVWGSKTPQFSENVYKINALFPDAKIIYIKRDIRDICLSWKNKWAKDMYLCASKWSNRQQYILDFLNKSTNNIIISFEEIITETEFVCRQLCDFLGLTFSENMLEHSLHTNDNIDGKKNYGKKIDVGNIGKWNRGLTLFQCRRIEQIAFNTMLITNYKPIYAKSHVPLKLIEKINGYVRDIFSFVFIGNRFSSKNKIRTRFIKLYLEIRKRI